MVSKRVKAKLLDFIILLCFCFIMFFVFAIAIYDELEDYMDIVVVDGITETEKKAAIDELIETVEPETNILTISYAITVIFIFGIIPILNSGSTIGKKVMKIKVSNMDNTTTLWFNHLFRSHYVMLALISIIVLTTNELSILTILTTIQIIIYLLFIINLILLLSSSDGRRFQDKLLKLNVVYIEPNDYVDNDNDSNDEYSSSDNEYGDPLSDFE